MDFERLVRQHKDSVYRQMLRVCGNREDAEDALVEALLKAYRALPSLTSPEAFQPWLTQIARRTCFRLKKHPSVGALSALAQTEVEPAAPDNPLADVLEKELKECLLRGLQQMPTEYREVYELRELEELSGPETAAKLGISLAAVKSRLHRARSHIRQVVDESLGELNALDTIVRNASR